MKITKKGIAKIKRNIYFQSCSDCGCEFEYYEKDMLKYGSDFTCGFVVCPCCGKQYFKNDHMLHPIRIETIIKECDESGKFEYVSEE